MLPTTRPGEEQEQKPQTGGDHTFGGRMSVTPANGLRVVFPSAKSGVRGRIMPALPHNVLSPKDSAFKDTYLPYRDASTICPKTGHPVWSWWFFDKFEIHRFWGPNNRTFVSPRTLRAFGEDNRAKTIDPIDRANYLVKQSEKWSHLKYHAEFSMDKRSPRYLNMPQQIGLCNFYGKFGEAQNDEVFLLGLTPGGFKFIMNQLNKAPSTRSPAHDPANWPDYMFGDVTDPKTGLVAWSAQKDIGNGRSANTLVFSNLDDFLKDHSIMEIPEAALARRCNFFNLDSEIKVSTPEEIVNYLVDETDLPLDLIKEAVGEFVSVPQRKAAPVENKSDFSDDDIDTRPLPPVTKPATTHELASSAPWKQEETNTTTAAPKSTAVSSGAAVTEAEMQRFAELTLMKDEGRIGTNPELYMELFRLEAKIKASKQQ